MSGKVLPDPRRHAYRADLAAEQLRGTVEAPRYVKGELRQVGAPSLPLRREPRFDATLDTEALLGETVTLFEEQRGLGLGATRPRRLCRLHAEREGLTAAHRDADPSDRGAAQLCLPGA